MRPCYRRGKSRSALVARTRRSRRRVAGLARATRATRARQSSPARRQSRRQSPSSPRPLARRGGRGPAQSLPHFLGPARPGSPGSHKPNRRPIDEDPFARRSHPDRAAPCKDATAAAAGVRGHAAVSARFRPRYRAGWCWPRPRGAELGTSWAAKRPLAPADRRVGHPPRRRALRAERRPTPKAAGRPGRPTFPRSNWLPLPHRSNRLSPEGCV